MKTGRRQLPMSYSAPMIRGLMTDAKTQTRRGMYFDGIDEVEEFVHVGTDKLGRKVFEMKGRVGQHVSRPAGRGMVEYLYWPKFAVGDQIYAREHWKVDKQFDKMAPREMEKEIRPFWYLAGYPIPAGGTPFWSMSSGADFDASAVRGRHRQAMHMPRWASRITLEVTDVRIQRLNDCDDADALAEGVVPHPSGLGYWVPGVEHPDPNFPWLSRTTPREMYAALWDTINGSGTWGANPWITAYTFTVHIGNIDDMEVAP